MFSTMSPVRKWLCRHALSRTKSAKSPDDYPPKEACLPPLLQYFGPCCISLLPNELLTEIFEYLMPQASIQHVCQRWTRLFDHLSVGHIDLGFRGWYLLPRINGLHSKLKRYPELYTHVRSISIKLDEPPINNCEAIGRMITLCVALQSISLHLDWNIITWPIVRAISKLTAVRTLSLSETYPMLPLEVVFDHFNQPSLCCLDLSRYGVRNAYLLADWAMEKHTSGVTELILRNPATTPEATECVVRRSSRLVRLTLDNTWGSRYEERYSVDAVQRILDIHHLSLTYIGLELRPGSIQFIPDFRAYTCLRVLRLSAHAVFDTTPQAVSRALSTPSLQHLIIAHSTYICLDTVLWRSKPQANVEWLQRFVTHHLTIEGTNLCSIIIDFTPDSLNHSDLHPDRIWRWEQLGQTNDPRSDYGLISEWILPARTSED